MTKTTSVNTTEGIHAQLTFEADKPMRKFLKDLPAEFGEAFHPDDIHTSVLYPDELAAAGLGSSERDSLHEVVDDIRARLVGQEIIGREVELVPNLIRPYKKFLGLEVVDSPEVDAVRIACTDVIFERLGIDLGGCLDDPHVSVARRMKGEGCRKLIKYERNFPEKLKIAGVEIGVKTVTLAAAKKQRYVNDSTKHCEPGGLYS